MTSLSEPQHTLVGTVCVATSEQIALIRVLKCSGKWIQRVYQDGNIYVGCNSQNKFWARLKRFLPLYSLVILRSVRVNVWKERISQLWGLCQHQVLCVAAGYSSSRCFSPILDNVVWHFPQKHCTLVISKCQPEERAHSTDHCAQRHIYGFDMTFLYQRSSAEPLPLLTTALALPPHRTDDSSSAD